MLGGYHHTAILAWNISIFRNDFEKGRKLLPYSIRLCSKRFVSLILFQFNLFVCDFQLITQGNWFRTNFRLPSFFVLYCFGFFPPHTLSLSLVHLLACAHFIWTNLVALWQCSIDIKSKLTRIAKGKNVLQNVIRHKPKKFKT